MSDLSYIKDSARITPLKFSDEIRRLTKKFPFIKVKTIGKSVFGYPIHALEIGKESWPKNLLIGGFLGNDCLSANTLLEFTERISSAVAAGNSINGRSTGDIFSGRGISIIPLINPDGAEISVNGAEHDKTGRLHRLCGKNYEKWEANAKGVDLNLNFGSRRHGAPKEKGKTRQFGPSYSGWAGMYPHSEPEVTALSDYCLENKFISSVIFFEGDNNVIFRTGENYRESGIFAARFAKAAGYTLETNDSPLSPAGFKNWFSSLTGHPAIEVYAKSDSVNSLFAAITRIL